MTTRRAKTEREQAIFAEPETLDDLCEHIVQRGSLASWCKLRDVRFMPAREWLASDPKRQASYTAALEAKDAHLTDRVLDGIDRLVDFDPRHAFDDKGKVLQAHRLPDDVAFAVSGVETGTDEKGRAFVKLRVPGRDRGLEIAGRRLGLFRDKLEVSGTLGLASRIAKAQQRVKSRTS